MLESWDSRSQIVANLLNPAFLGVILRQAASGYQLVDQRGMPFAFAPLVLPLVLHPLTRQSLPADIRTSFPTWIVEHRELLIELPRRIRELMPHTKEAISFAVKRNSIIISNGCLQEGNAKLTGKTNFPKMSPEMGDIWKRSSFVGKWLAGAGNAATVYGIVGIRP